MTRLSTYLAKFFAVDAIALLVVAAFLLFLVQSLRMFDVVSVKGQDLLTLLGQALLVMPTLIRVFLFVCVGIGLARGLRALQASQELHIIHSSRRVPALLTAIAGYTGAWVLVALVLAHVVEPISSRQFNEWSASVAADLVGRTLMPNRFAEVVPGVTMVIGARAAKGELTDFFADDKRDRKMRRTYIAKSATVAADEEGYVLQLRDGAIQYMSDEHRFSEVAFTRYDIALERLTGPAETERTVGETNSIELVAQALATGIWDAETFRLLNARTEDAVRVLAMCLFVAAMAAFPHGRRVRHEAPIELVVLFVAFLERGISTGPMAGGPFHPVGGAYLLAAASLVVLLVRLQVFVPAAPRAPA